MTALVGVLNKRGAVIAADSAVTITSKGKSKIYNNEQKIFPLSDQYPIAVMVCNNLNFLSTPLELIFELYRKERGGSGFGSVTGYVEDFIDFLKSFKQLQHKDMKDIYYQNEFEAIISSFKSIFEEKCDEIMEESPDIEDSKLSKICYNHTFQALKELILSEDIIPQLKNFSKTDFFKEVVEANNEFYAHYRSLFPKMSDKEWAELLDLFYYHLKSIRIILPEGSELIFVGYGTDDIFPASQRLFLSGMVGNEIKYDLEEIHAISHEDTAEIRPFAQTDVMHTLLSGIAPNMDSEYADATLELEAALIEDITRLLKKENVSQKIIKKVSEIPVEKIHEKFKERIAQFSHENFTDGVVDALEFFNYDEMAKMAENLIAVTNLQRHISSSEESVGGFIEVALLTKTGGFRWLKHKKL